MRPEAEPAVCGVRIARVEAIPVGLPLADPMVMGGRRYERSESLLVRVIGSDGTEGWGEAAPLSAHGDRLPALVAEVREAIAPAITGLKLDQRAMIATRLVGEMRCSARSAAAVDIALADALARACGLRVADLEGGPVRDSLVQKWLIGGPTVETDLAEVALRHGQGISFFMLKVGSRPLNQDVSLTTRLHEIYGQRIRLCADANGAWTRQQALAFLAQTENVDLVYLEQPLASDDLSGAASAAAASRVPFGADEAVSVEGDIVAAHGARATSGINIKPSKFGGLAPAVRAGTLCDALKLKVALATPMAESSIGTAAALHVAAVLPQVDWGIAPSSDYLAEDLVETPIRHVAGRLHVPTGPGLGVQVEPRLVDRFRLDR
jgi:L-alanine-DL-glutamate epimerase-like enolase superfamily enzyme